MILSSSTTDGFLVFEEAMMKVLEEYTPGNSIVIEEREPGEDLEEPDVYLSNGKIKFIDMIESSSSNPYSFGYKKFIRREIEPVKKSEKGSRSKKKVWKLKGIEVKILDVFTEGWGYIYEKCGWKGLKETIKYLKKAKKDPLGVEMNNTKMKPKLLNSLLGTGYRDLKWLQESRQKYADRNDIGLEEAIVTLRLCDDEFNERYENLQKRIIRKAEKTNFWDKILKEF